jgi:hypothetical protein
VRYGCFFKIKKKSNFLTYSWRISTDALQVFFFEIQKKAAAIAGEVTGEVAGEELTWLSFR